MGLELGLGLRQDMARQDIKTRPRDNHKSNLAKPG